MRLTREVRCFLPAGTAVDALPLNSWAGTSGPLALGPFLLLRAEVEGPVDARTGYLFDIKQLEGLLRGPVVQQVRAAMQDQTGSFGARLARALQTSLRGDWPGLEGDAKLRAIEVGLSPYTRLRATTVDPTMIHLTQSFEFAAAHRLYCPQLSDEENRRMFGKCSNPHGHGHNYVLEVTLVGEPNDLTGTVIDLPTLDREVRRRVIEPLDHKNLNLECPDFAALNPTVENIARVIWTRLQPAFTACRLESVRVYETPKTCAEYCGDQPL